MPRPCGRLATAAVFVSVSVVQFIAGLILLKSRYLYLLSGPDFWTAASNLAVGVLLGLSVGVWRDVRKTSFKHIVRRNLLASLVGSAIAINVTTTIILILGEGNALLSIQLENDGKYSSKSEILAYSYATSVCSPIVSVVVAIVFLSGMWFQVSEKGMKTPEIKSILRKDSIDDYNWVFKARQSPSKPYSKIVRKELSFKSLSSSSDDESFSLTDAKLWSNSVYSIEYLNASTRRKDQKTGINHLKKIRQELSFESDKKFKNTPERSSHETSRVSFAKGATLKNILKFSPYASRRYLENDTPFSPNQIEAVDKNVICRSYKEFKKKHSRKMSKQFQKKRRMLLMGHPAFQQFHHLDGDTNLENFHKYGSPEVLIPRARIINESQLSTSFEVKTEVHMDPKSQDSGVYENASKSAVFPCKDVSFCDVLSEIIERKTATLQRTSTSKNLKNIEVPHPQYENSVNRKVCRTSTAAGQSSSHIPHLDISDIQNDSVIDQNESYESEKGVDSSDIASPESAVPGVDPDIEVDDSFVEVPQSNALAGEVVKVKVNSLPRNSFHSKLVPVTIPVFSSVRKKSLKRQRENPFTLSTVGFSDRNKVGFSSFRCDLKAMNQRNSRSKADEENLLDQKYETINGATIYEISLDENLPPSPAKTSGYDSAIFENTHLSDSEYCKPNMSSSVTNSPYYTPKKKFPNIQSPRNLDVVQ